MNSNTYQLMLYRSLIHLVSHLEGQNERSNNINHPLTHKNEQNISLVEKILML